MFVNLNLLAHALKTWLTIAWKHRPQSRGGGALRYSTPFIFLKTRQCAIFSFEVPFFTLNDASYLHLQCQVHQLPSQNM